MTHSGELLPEAGRLQDGPAAAGQTGAGAGAAGGGRTLPSPVPPQSSVVNGLWNALSSGVVALVGLISSVIVVRTLSPHDYGVMSYYLWLAGLCGTLGMLAFPPALTKVGAELLGAGQRTMADALARWVGQVLGWINLAIVGGLVVAALFLPENAVFLYIIAAVQLPTALASVISSRFWSHQNFRVVSLWNVVAAVVQMLLIAAALRLQLGIPGFTFAVLSAGLTSWLGLLWQARIFGGRGGSRSAVQPLPAPALRHYLAFLAPASLAMVFETVVWQRSELYFINKLGDAVQVGHYSLAYTIFAIFLSIGWALVTSFFPSIAGDHGGGHHHLIARKLQQGAAVAVLYAVPISCGGSVTLGTVIALLYGDKMLPALPIGQMLLVSLVPSVLAGMFSLTINAIGGIWLNVALGLAVAVVNVGLDLVLIPRYGAFGGAVATVISQLLYLAGLLVLARVRFGLSLKAADLLKIVLAGVLSTLLVPALIGRALPGQAGLIVSVLVGAGLYALFVWKAGYLALLRPEGRSQPLTPPEEDAP